MWILLVLTLAVMSALTVIQTPREWLKNKLLRIVILIYHTVGITSIALILFAVCRMKDGLLREIIIWTETFYFTLRYLEGSVNCLDMLSILTTQPEQQIQEMKKMVRNYLEGLSEDLQKY